VNGLTFPATNRIQLSPFVCQVLAQTLGRSAQQPLFTAFAVTLLAHESAHASGIKAEGRAECRAIETEPRAAQLLGLPRTLAARLQHIYRGTVYPNDLPRYRTPACRAGLPGAVVPDTLGSAGNLRPLRRDAAAAARVLPGWRNLGGEVGPLSPCAPVKSRTFELARFDEFFSGPRGESLTYSSATLRTEKEFATAVVRQRALLRCDLALLRKDIRESHSTDTVSAGRIPDSIARLSPLVHAFREIYTSHGKRWDRDSITIFDGAKRITPELFFRAPAGELPVLVELRATAACLRALGRRS
jgi:hypothetical protein